MKLSQLLSVYPQLSWGEDPTADVSQVCVDSRKVEPGCVFVAIRGYKMDGHQYVQQACEAGAIALVLEDRKVVPEDFSGAVVVVENTRSALDLLASRFYGDPAKSLFCVGVTGTNGKTSVAYMVEKVFSTFGWPAGVMGTIDHHLGDRQWASELTTPDPLTLNKRLSEFQALSAKAAIFEVSSHALSQHRADQIPFDVMVFTNLSRDHLDYHKDMEEYFLAKQRLFTDVPLQHQEKSSVALINADDPYGQRLQVASGVRRWTFGQKQADFLFTIVDQNFSGTHFHLRTPRGDVEVHLPVPGKHNVYNAVAAIGVGLAAGISLESCVTALASFTGVPGRLQRVRTSKQIQVFVDYAHTDHALRSVLEALAEVRKASEKPSSRIILVFGCGGGRDQGKRPLMAKAAHDLADLVVMTSDNPREEDPEAIIADGLKAVPKEALGQTFLVEADRRKAIEMALEMAHNDDVVLIAGKGHEDYQIVGTEKRPFSDVQVVEELGNEYEI